jgi:hypothetical protein
MVEDMFLFPKSKMALIFVLKSIYARSMNFVFLIKKSKSSPCCKQKKATRSIHSILILSSDSPATKYGF